MPFLKVMSDEGAEALGRAAGLELGQTLRALADRLLGPGLVIEAAPGTKIAGLAVEGRITIRTAPASRAGNGERAPDA